ncbi:MAG: Bug family tripartite tricarboxylate transporter substrate binding protein [Burkholderiales bacterium]
MKTTLQLIAAALLIAVTSTYVAAQGSAKRSVRVLTPATPGGPGDVQIRILLPKLSESLGQTLIVENRASNNGIVAMEIVAKATPDGHTLAVGNSGTHSINPSLYKKLPYDPLRDFIAVSQFSTTGMMVAAHPRLPGTSIQDLVAYAKNNPGKLNVAIAGATGELAGNALWFQMQLKLTNVNYKGSAPSTLAILSGEADLALLTPLAIQSHIRSGKLKAYGVTSKERSPVLPDVPTMAEQGVTGYDFPYWNGLFVTAGTPDRIVKTLHRVLVSALQDPDVKDRFRQLGLVPVGNTPQEFRAVVARDIEKYRKIIADSGIPRL